MNDPSAQQQPSGPSGPQGHRPDVETAAEPVGSVYLSSSGTPVGQLTFTVAPDAEDVEVGSPVVVDTADGQVVAAITDMRAVGTLTHPAANLYADAPSRLTAMPGDPGAPVFVADARVLDSPRRRPIGDGPVYPASAAQLSAALGADRMGWPLPAGVVDLVGGGVGAVPVDGEFLLGPQAAHIIVNGMTGAAAKTSFAMVLLASAFAHGNRIASEPDGTGRRTNRTAALVFNVKGADLLHLDEPATGRNAPVDEDLAMYAAMGVPAAPFPEVSVYAPSAGAGGGANCVRADAMPLRWDLPVLWPYMPLLHRGFHEDDIFKGFYHQFRDQFLTNRRPGARRIDTLEGLDAFLAEQIETCEMEQRGTGWGNLHVASMWRIKRIFGRLAAAGQGLITEGRAGSGEDVPVDGWRHGEVRVIDLSALDPDMQALVVARVSDRLLAQAVGDRGLGVDHVAVFADELNEFAPASGGVRAEVRRTLSRIAATGRFAGVSLVGAAQKMSKIDEMVRDQASTVALGRTADSELDHAAYGRMSPGLRETVAGLPQGRMLLRHQTYRAPMVVRFPRPAWRTGAAIDAVRPDAAQRLGLTAGQYERLTEGVPADIAAAEIAASSSVDEARRRLAAHREPDMHRRTLVGEPRQGVPDGLDDLEGAGRSDSPQADDRVPDGRFDLAD